MNRLSFHVNDELVTVSDVSPTTTLLNFLRERLRATGTKEGCAEGDCGACTVALLDASDPERPTYRAVNACLVFLPMLQGRRVYTVEGLKSGAAYHPVQDALVERLGSQCGYCTPGVVMSMFEACYRDDLREPAWQIDDQMCGNLCRCTGYRPIREAAAAIAGARPEDRFSARLREAMIAKVDHALTPRATLGELSYRAEAQRYFNPMSKTELFEVLAHNPDARFVVGGTDLGLEVTKKFRVPACLVSLEGVPELRAATRDAGGVWLGAAMTLTEIQERLGGEPAALEKMLRFFASRQIRNRATVGGNLCTASPIGDLAPVLIALGARVRLSSASASRELPLEDFFLAYRKTALAPGEVMEAVYLPDLPEGARATSFKVSKRRELDISAVSAGCYVRVDASGTIAQARLAFGGMAATPKRATAVEGSLVGRPFARETFDAASERIPDDFQPISDQRASAWYRTQVAKNLVYGFWLEVKDASSPGAQCAPLSPRPTSTVHAGEAP